MNEKEMLDELRALAKDKGSWKDSIDDTAEKLDGKYSPKVRAKALWILGEMGLKHPAEIEKHVDMIASFLVDEDPKLRERSANALGRIGRAKSDVIIPHLQWLMSLGNDESPDVRHAFIWACENMATSELELFSDKLEVFLEMMDDDSDRVRIEAPEMFRVIGKRKPECVMPYLEKLERIAEEDENPVVRIHASGAVRITRKAMNE